MFDVFGRDDLIDEYENYLEVHCECFKNKDCNCMSFEEYFDSMMEEMNSIYDEYTEQELQKMGA